MPLIPFYITIFETRGTVNPLSFKTEVVTIFQISHLSDSALDYSGGKGLMSSPYSTLTSVSSTGISQLCSGLYLKTERQSLNTKGTTETAQSNTKVS